MVGYITKSKCNASFKEIHQTVQSQKKTYYCPEIKFVDLLLHVYDVANY